MTAILPQRNIGVITYAITQPIKTWFDSGDIASGSVFADQISKGITDTSLLCVLTDNYASREWCKKEILLAKEHQRRGGD
ncbi:MAG: toll/interleukin-1 receptor domain-containing protein [Thiohalomonadales bacterium]